MDTWPMWVKAIVATLIMAAFWGIMILPWLWEPLVIVPLALMGFILFRALTGHPR